MDFSKTHSLRSLVQFMLRNKQQTPKDGNFVSLLLYFVFNIFIILLSFLLLWLLRINSQHLTQMCPKQKNFSPKISNVQLYLVKIDSWHSIPNGSKASQSLLRDLSNLEISTCYAMMGTALVLVKSRKDGPLQLSWCEELSMLPSLATARELLLAHKCDIRW